MFIEVLDQLRCANGHEATWLVASFERVDNRMILDATLGCPLCFRQYRVTHGIVYFETSPTDVAAHRRSVSAAMADDAEAAVRVAAFLAAVERAVLVLAGEWSTAADGVTALLPLHAIALNPAVAIRDREEVSIIESPRHIPLAAGAVHGVALDASTNDAAMVASAVQVLRPNGRLVAPAETPVPDGVNVLARDERHWVAEKQSSLVQLRR